MQMNAELFRELSVIAEDEDMMAKALRALRRITSAHKKAMPKDLEVVENEPELPESFKRIRGMGEITQEDIDNDERLAYILSK
jgi:hypothetical protein